MSSELTVTLSGETRVVPVGTMVREVLDGIPSRELVAARIDGKVVDLTTRRSSRCLPARPRVWR
jgi:hypothetical protein